jgi:hypothetical protein
MPIIQHAMSELYVYYTVLYQKILGLWHQYNTYSTNVTYETRAPLRGSVSYQPKSDSDPALLATTGQWGLASLYKSKLRHMQRKMVQV